MKRTFTPGLAVFVLLALMTAVVNAQDADNPWHLIAFENDVEVALGIEADMLIHMQSSYNIQIARKNKKLIERFNEIKKITAVL